MENWYVQRDYLMANAKGEMQTRQYVRKLPYKYSYRLLSEGDDRPRTMMIEDWEIGALFWNCLRRTDGDEDAANALVREKYFDTFLLRHRNCLSFKSRDPRFILLIYASPQCTQLPVSLEMGRYFLLPVPASR